MAALPTSSLESVPYPVSRIGQPATVHRHVGGFDERLRQVLLAGLRREIGPDGDLQAAYRKWYAEQMEEHDRTMLHMMA